MKTHNKETRAKRVRSRIKGTERPRLSVFISNQHIYAQIINDKEGKTVIYAQDQEVGKGKKIEVASKVGELLGQKAKAAKIQTVVFDRGNKKYHGRVKALAEAARKEINF